MTALIPATFGPLSSKFANQSANDDLSSGIQSSFGLIGYKGKVWSIRYRGEETPLMREDGDGPKSSIEVVILSASKAVSKVWYEQGYVEGSTAAPDCFSNNGIAPDAASTKPQCASCALCPMNQWGSRMTPAGKNGKACSDSKRLAVVPVQDLPNEMFGGPMLLRVPAASLQDLAMYGQKMSQLGYPYYAIATRIAFDTAESYPKFVFGAIRPLTDEEGEIVLGERTNHTVERILSENEFATPPAEAAKPDVASAFEQPPAEEAKAAPAKSNVGDQARAAAAANKARVEADKAAQADGSKVAQAALAKAAKPDTKPVDTAVVDAAKTKKQQEAAERKRQMEAEIAALEAADDEEVTSEGNEETEEDRELREMEERMAALKAKKQAAAGTTAAPAPKKTTAPQQEAAPAPDPEENDSVASDFEAELDGLLDDLLPS
jgi:hypothetical protein